jgi:YidC/Oxa1 family membrane protein insertase
LDKNTAIGLGLIFVLFVAWMYVAQPSDEELAQMRTERQQADSIAAIQEENTSSETAETGQPSSNQRQGTELVGSADSDKQRSATVGSFVSSYSDTVYTVIETDFYRAEFSNLGAGPVKMTLKEYNNWAGSPVQMIRDTTRSAYNLGFVSTENYNVEFGYLLFEPVSSRKTISITGKEKAELSYRLRLSNGAVVTYTYYFSAHNYEIGLDVNFGQAATLVGGYDIDFAYNGGLSYTERTRKTELQARSADVYAGGEHEDVLLTESGSDELGLTGTIDWVSTQTKFFTQIIKPLTPTESALIEGAMFGDSDDPNATSEYRSEVTLNVSPDDPVAKFSLYMGPLRMNTLTAFDESTYELVDLGYSFMRFFSEPLVRYVIIPYFEFIIGFLGSYGWAIVLFGVMIKLVLYPFTKKSFESMAAMRAIAPQMEELKKKFGDDPQKQQQEMMKLYKKAGANPLGGCLPNLLQMPILVTLWMFFQSSILIRQESFLWAPDLSAPDVILSLPFTIPFMGDHISGFVLLMAASMIVQMQLSGQTASNPQMKFLPFIMPVVLFVFFNNLASGLSLYYFVYNMVSIAQQAYINKGIDKDELQKKLENGNNKKKKRGRGKK